MSTLCPGIFYNGISAEKIHAHIEFQPDCLIIHAEATKETWLLGEYKFERPNNNTFILSKEGKQLVFTRNTIEAYFYNNPLKNNYKIFFKVSRWRTYLIGIMVILSLGYFLTMKATDHILGKFSLEDQKNFFSFFDGEYENKNCMSEDTQKMIGRILEETNHSNEINKIFYIKSSEVNAYALPSGSLVFTDAFLEQMESVEEFIAVLFHEIGHIKNRHHLKRLRDTIGVQALSIIVFREHSQIGTTLGSFVLQAYSSSQEEESDEYSRRKLDEFGISRKGAIDFFERMKDKDHFQLLSTHPSSVDRAEFFNENRPLKNKKEYFPEMLKILKGCKD